MISVSQNAFLSSHCRTPSDHVYFILVFTAAHTSQFQDSERALFTICIYLSNVTCKDEAWAFSAAEGQVHPGLALFHERNEINDFPTLEMYRM